ncbi:MAG: PhoH family protein [Candidatus Sumerlaeales bacterium]|nr:PhoH family protein [Candidatus Sumerlaeales bacterium]
MAKRKLQEATIDSFFGITLTDEQEVMKSAIMSHPRNLITIVPGRSGSGKTTVSLGCAKLLVATRGFDCLRYIFATPFENKLGFRPGEIAAKESAYVRPLFGALETINERPECAIEQMACVDFQKGGVPWIKAYSLNFIRGETYKNCVVWIDEAQNANPVELRLLLSRIDDSCVTIVTGDPNQCDIGLNRSGFQKCIDTYKDKDFATICDLTQNFRGLVSSTAEQI